MKLQGLDSFYEARNKIEKDIKNDFEDITKNLIDLHNAGEVLSFMFIQSTIKLTSHDLPQGREKDITKMYVKLKGNQEITLGGEYMVLNYQKLLKDEFANATVTDDTKDTVKKIHGYLKQLNAIEQVPVPDLKERHEYSKNNLNAYYKFREPLLPEPLAHLAPTVEKIVFEKKHMNKDFQVNNKPISEEERIFSKGLVLEISKHPLKEQEKLWIAISGSLKDMFPDKEQKARKISILKAFADELITDKQSMDAFTQGINIYDKYSEVSDKKVKKNKP